MAAFCHPASEFFSQFPEIVSSLSYQNHIARMRASFGNWWEIESKARKVVEEGRPTLLESY